MAEDTWFARDLPVLDWLVQYFDGDGEGDPDAAMIAAGTNLPEGQVSAALRSLARCQPPYLVVVTVPEERDPLSVIDVTADAYRAVGAWPTAESFADRLVARLDEEADREPDPERKSRLQQTARYLGGGLRDVVVDFAATYAARQAGL